MNPHLEKMKTAPRIELETLFRQNAQAVNIGDSHVLCRVLGHYLFVIDAQDCSVGAHLALNGFWEMWIAIAIARHVKAGMRCIDVGANAGYYTVMMGELVGPTGFVQSWEPLEPLVGCLRRTVPLNGIFDQCEIVPCAASDVAGQRLIQIPQGYWGGASLEPLLRDWTGGTHKSMVETRRLSDTPGRIDFIKVDVEGHEHEVWRGAKELLDRNPHMTWLVEFNTPKYKDAAGFLDDIQAEGFPLARVDFNGNIEPITREQILAAPEFEMLWLTR